MSWNERQVVKRKSIGHRNLEVRIGKEIMGECMGISSSFTKDSCSYHRPIWIYSVRRRKRLIRPRPKGLVGGRLCLFARACPKPPVSQIPSKHKPKPKNGENQRRSQPRLSLLVSDRKLIRYFTYRNSTTCAQRQKRRSSAPKSQRPRTNNSNSPSSNATRTSRRCSINSL